jgi:glycine betaine/proline transport system permease protein
MTFEFSPGAWLAPVVDWLNTNFHGLFAAISAVIEAVLGAIQGALLFPPVLVVLLLAAALAWVLLGWRMDVLTAVALGFCFLMDLWEESMEMNALASVSVAISVAIALPLGILAVRRPQFEAALRPILDIMQTVPPWVYLIPAVMIFSLGRVPAIIATIFYGIPPMLRLTTLAFRQIRRDLIELGHTIRAAPRAILFKIEVPSAIPTLAVASTSASCCRLPWSCLRALSAQAASRPR